MGKIFTRFSVANCINGLPFRIMQEIISSLPGETEVSGLTIHTGSNSLHLDMNNPNFADGTEIQANYISRPYTVNGQTVYHATFNGITIIDPPAQTSTWSTGPFPLTQGNGTYTLSYKYIALGSGGSSGDATIIKIMNDTSESKSNKCTCGATSVGGLHSSWCDKHA